jgi:hypothetical protein
MGIVHLIRSVLSIWLDIAGGMMIRERRCGSAEAV